MYSKRKVSALAVDVGCDCDLDAIVMLEPGSLANVPNFISEFALCIWRHIAGAVARNLGNFGISEYGASPKNWSFWMAPFSDRNGWNMHLKVFIMKSIPHLL